MNANKFFSFNRFILLIRNDLILNRKQYLFSILGVFIVGFIYIKMQMPTVLNPFNFESSRYINPFGLFLLGLSGIIGTSFQETSNKISRASYLLLPFSTFEKYTAQFFVRIILGTLIFAIIFWIDAHLARLTTLATLSGKLTTIPVIEPFHFSDLYYFKADNTQRILSLMTMFTVGTGLFSFKLFFNKSGLVKSVISLVGVILIISCLMIIFSHMFFPETKGFDMKLYQYNVFGKLSNLEVYISSLLCFSWLFLLPLGYYKLKEKQI